MVATDGEDNNVTRAHNRFWIKNSWFRGTDSAICDVEDLRKPVSFQGLPFLLWEKKSTEASEVGLVCSAHHCVADTWRSACCTEACGDLMCHSIHPLFLIVNRSIVDVQYYISCIIITTVLHGTGVKQSFITFKGYIPFISSVAQLCPTVCDPMNRSTPGLPVHHQLPEFTQTHVHRLIVTIKYWLYSLCCTICPCSLNVCTP